MRSRTMSKKGMGLSRVGALAVVLAMVLVACGGTDTTTRAGAAETTTTAAGEVTTTAGGEDTTTTAAAAATLDDLYAAAQEEGTVVWHVGFSEDQALVLEEAFEAAYPGVDVQPVSIETEEVVPRIIAESQAGNVTIDVATGRTDTIEPLVERDLIETVDWLALDDTINPEAILFDNRMIRMYDFVNGWLYNTSLLSADEIPTTWEDLLDPKWKGQIVADAGGDLGLAALVARGEWTEDQAREFIEGFVANEPGLVGRGTVALNKVGTGEYPIGAAPIQPVPQMNIDGATLELLPIGPLSALATSMLVPVGAPHPNAARLLVAWLASGPGREVWDSVGRGLALPCDASGFSQMVCDAGIEIEVVDDFEEATFEAAIASIAAESYIGLEITDTD